MQLWPAHLTVDGGSAVEASLAFFVAIKVSHNPDPILVKPFVAELHALLPPLVVRWRNGRHKGDEVQQRKPDLRRSTHRAASCRASRLVPGLPTGPPAGRSGGQQPHFFISLPDVGASEDGAAYKASVGTCTNGASYRAARDASARLALFSSGYLVLTLLSSRALFPPQSPTMLGIFAAPITNAILLYCGYLSFKAIESDKGNDDTRTCTCTEMKYGDLAIQISPTKRMSPTRDPCCHPSARRMAPLLPPASDGASAS